MKWGRATSCRRRGWKEDYISLRLNDLSIVLLVTDRHRQIDAWLRNAQPDIKHRYDVWHVAKCKAKHNN